MRYTYNNVGLLTSAVYSGANQIDLYTPITRGITYKTVDGNPNKLSSLIDTYDGFTYTYDNVGNIKSVSGSSKHNAAYIYDETNQLTNASGYYDTERFVYDYNGNITKYYNTYSEQGNTTEYEYTYHYDNSWKDRLTSITNGSGQTIRSYMYGDNYSVGSTLPTSDGRFEFEWDGRMLTRARRLSDYTVIDYKYDADGNRTEKKVTNADGAVQRLIKYYYTDGVMTTEVNYLPNSGTLTADTKVDYIYDNTGLAFVMVEVYNSDNNYYVSTGKYTFYVKRNAQGDVTSLIDITSGNTGDSIDYIYTAYGRHYIEGISGDVSMMIADLNTVTYKGYSYDSDLEMYYLGSRWYDPEVCRFINGDSYVSTGQDITGFNMFAYCNNNPANMIDLNGTVPDEILLKNAEIYLAGGNIAMCGWENNGTSTKSSESKFRNKDGTYSLYDNYRNNPNSVFHEQILSGDASVGVNLSDGNLGVSASAILITGGWEFEHLDLSVLDFAKAEIGIGVTENYAGIGAQATLWAPSVTIPIFGLEIGLEGDIGSVGAKVAYDNGKFVAGFSYGIGGSISISRR